MASSGGGGRPQSSRSRKPEDPSVRISKDMSKLLRHSPPPGAMDAAGWVSLPVLLSHLRGNPKPTEQVVRTIVDSNEKKRFVLDDTTVPPRIRAAQGHSVALDAPLLAPVTDATTVPCAIHVTGTQGWHAIQNSGELQRMNRTHIHFATQPHMMRSNSWVTVILRLDLQEALAAGFLFFLSSNDVLLCEGPLPVRFVRLVEAAELPQEWQAALRVPAPAGAQAAQAAKRGREPPAGLQSTAVTLQPPTVSTTQQPEAAAAAAGSTGAWAAAAGAAAAGGRGASSGSGSAGGGAGGRGGGGAWGQAGRGGRGGSGVSASAKAAAHLHAGGRP